MHCYVYITQPYRSAKQRPKKIKNKNKIKENKTNKNSRAFALSRGLREERVYSAFFFFCLITATMSSISPDALVDDILENIAFDGFAGKSIC